MSSLLRNIGRTIVRLSFAVLVCGCLLCAGIPQASFAYADDYSIGSVTVSEDGTAAVREKSPFGLENFNRAMVGSNRSIDETYIGYAYYIGDSAEHMAAVVIDKSVVVYIPQSQVQATSFSFTNSTYLEDVQYLLTALDEVNCKGGTVINPDTYEWYFTSDSSYTLGNALIAFGIADNSGRYYVTVKGIDGSDVTKADNPYFTKLGQCDFADLRNSDEITVLQAPTGLAAVKQFFGKIDYSPLFVTLKTTLTAIVFIFVLGLAAAYWLVRLPSRAQDVFDAIFTIPMVLPPTVCGFLLLLLLGRNTPIGNWFIDIGFPLIFSWPATVIAAIVVAFPLMYRSARGAFETVDENMQNAARTLGWSNGKIFLHLTLPLTWPSIAAGTVLAFARALGEFGATLFLAGNYAGITQTIPIAIYFQWTNGNADVALFWTVVVIIFSFIVIVFINLWSKRTMRYKRPIEEKEVAER